MWGCNTDPLWSTFVVGEMIADAHSYDLGGGDTRGILEYKRGFIFGHQPFEETLVEARIQATSQFQHLKSLICRMPSYNKYK